MRIGDRHIGPDHPPYVIAEIGVNHDGDLDRALGLVDGAARSHAAVRAGLRPALQRQRLASAHGREGVRRLAGEGAQQPQPALELLQARLPHGGDEHAGDLSVDGQRLTTRWSIEAPSVLPVPLRYRLSFERR